MGALQFIPFCTHAPGKQNDICWGLLWKNRYRKINKY